MWIQSLGREDPLEEGMETHSIILVRRIPCTEEHGGLRSIGSQSQMQLKLFSTHTCFHLSIQWTHTFIDWLLWTRYKIQVILQTESLRYL